MYTIQGVLLPADSVSGNVTGNDAEAIVGTVRPTEFPENYANKPIKSAMGIRRTNGTRYFVILFLVLVANDPLIWHKKITYRFPLYSQDYTLFCMHNWLLIHYIPGYNFALSWNYVLTFTS